MTHAGLACLLAGMLLMGAWTGSPRFAGWRVAAPALGAAARSVAFVLLAAGFAGKAGVIPLHVWLPLAHPAAPSHVSALMSGVMIKLGVYGLLRAGLDWLGVGPAWWGVAVLLAGTVSSVIGVLYALVDHDLKRLLAFSSIENVGIILIGAGAGMLYHGAGLEGLALLALAAALYHTINHAAFKTLLFLGAGAVVHATGTRNMEGMGGLIKRMPWTAACFLVGSAAIAALPPLNGFVSEWLTFVALLQNTRIAQPILNLTFNLGSAGPAALRDVGVRPNVADVADGVHRDRLRRPVPACLRLLLPAREAAGHRVPPRGALLRPAYRVCEPDALDLRRLALSAGHRRAARRRPPRAGDPVGQRQRVPCLHPRGTHPLAGARVIAALLIALGQVLVAGAGAPLLVGVVRTLKARLAGRRGPSPWQPYADLRKLLGKEPVVSTTTSWVFRATPYVLVATMLVTALVVPVLVARPALGFAGNIILLMYLFMLGTFILALAGLDSGSAFGGMGSSREVAVAALAEPALSA